MSTPPSPPAPPRRRGRRIMLVVALVIVALVGAGIWYFTRPAPDEVDITQAAAAVTDEAATSTSEAGASTTATTTEGSASTGDAATTADGDWSVDTSIGEFSVTDTTGTFVGFRIDEELANVGATTAVGRTPGVEGTITIEGSSLTGAAFTADMTSIVSDRSRRDGAIQRALGTGVNPTATFVLSGPVDLGGTPGEGETVTATATGDLTINGVTQSVGMPVQAVWSGDVITVTGSLDILLSDYGVTAPTAPIVVSVADTATIELQLYLTRT